MKLFHGSPNHGIEKFNIDNPRYELQEGAGVYLTNDYRVARGYAGSEGCVYVCEIKSGAVFDATSTEEFLTLVARVSKLIDFDLGAVEYLDTTIAGLVSGQYMISGPTGVAWQLVNLLNNEEAFISMATAEAKLEQLRTGVEEYLSEHAVLKYLDKNLGLVYLAKDPLVLKIVERITIGSESDVDHL